MEELPNPSPILDLLNGFRRSKVLFTLVGLGIPELISDKQQVKLAPLARLLAAKGKAEPSHDGLGRLLDASVSLGLLGGNREDGYNLTPVAKTYLVGEYSLAGYITHSDQLLYKLWGELGTAVVTGQNCWNSAFGLDSADVFASLYKNDETVLRFMRGMHGFSRLSAHEVLTAFDLSGFRTLVDLGGATGALAAEACRVYPRMRAVVMDLPDVVETAQQHFAVQPSIEAVRDRMSWVAGDFFDQDKGLPPGDLYVLSRILHDWEEARCLKLLKRVAEHVPAGGAVLLCEMLLDESGTSPPEVLLQSLNMLTQTHGRERKLSEYSHLLQTAGFTRVEGKKTGTYLDVVVAYKRE